MNPPQIALNVNKVII